MRKQKSRSSHTKEHRRADSLQKRVMEWNKENHQLAAVDLVFREAKRDCIHVLLCAHHCYPGLKPAYRGKIVITSWSGRTYCERQPDVGLIEKLGIFCRTPAIV